MQAAALPAEGRRYTQPNGAAWSHPLKPRWEIRASLEEGRPEPHHPAPPLARGQNPACLVHSLRSCLARAFLLRSEAAERQRTLEPRKQELQTTRSAQCKSFPSSSRPPLDRQFAGAVANARQAHAKSAQQRQVSVRGRCSFRCLQV